MKNLETFFLKRKKSMSNIKEDNIRIIEALIFASEKSINIKDLKKKNPLR